MSTAKTATVVVRRGMGPLSILGIIFVLCKIFAVAPIAAWSWWLVLLPFYFPLALILAIWLIILAVIIVGAAFIGIAHVLESWSFRRRLKDRTRFRG